MNSQALIASLVVSVVVGTTLYVVVSSDDEASQEEQLGAHLGTQGAATQGGLHTRLQSERPADVHQEPLRATTKGPQGSAEKSSDEAEPFIAAPESAEHFSDGGGIYPQDPGWPLPADGWGDDRLEPVSNPVSGPSPDEYTPEMPVTAPEADSFDELTPGDAPEALDDGVPGPAPEDS